MKHKSLLMMLDVQSVFYGAQNLLGGQPRPRYGKLKYQLLELIELHAGPVDPVDAEAYVVQGDKVTGLDLFAMLSRNYRIDYTQLEAGSSGSVTTKMQLNSVATAGKYGSLIVVSGSGVFERAFKALKRNYPDIDLYLAAFANTMHKVYLPEGESEVSRIVTPFVIDETMI